MREKANRRPRVGEVRPSQIIHTFGVGAIVDLPNLSVIMMGLDVWDPPTSQTEIVEERLLTTVRSHLGLQVERLSLPPSAVDGSSSGAFDETPTVGVPVTPFPHWVRCPRCDLVAPIDFGVFDLKREPFRPDRTRYVHKNCPRSLRPPVVVPARFVVACENGHLDDFPWVHYVHRGATSCAAVLRLREFGVSAEAADIIVRCDTCGAGLSMALAFGEEGSRYLPPCRGSHPHLRSVAASGCKAEVKSMLAGASNLWFAVSISALSIPVATGKLEELVNEHWPILREVTSREILEAFRRIGQLEIFAEWSSESLWEAIEKKRTGPGSEEPKKVGELKIAEWDVFSRPDPRRNASNFRLREVSSPLGYERQLSKVVLVERLRVVKALTGFTRIGSPGDFGDVSEIPEVRRAPLARRPPTWVPATEVRGEGIFLSFREETLSAWLAAPAVEARDREFRDAHRDFRRLRGIDDPDAGFPGVRYILLHSLAHALIRQFAVECGYSAASLQERIYAWNAGAEAGPMAGILLYTAAADSEGTLGGLVSLGEPKTLGIHLDRALEQVRLCASDPLCAEHHPTREGVTLHGAACHACLFVSETSCERGNKYLDRALLVGTVTGASTAFFNEAPAFSRT